MVVYGRDLKLRAKRAFHGFGEQQVFSVGGAHGDVVEDDGG